MSSLKAVHAGPSKRAVRLLATFVGLSCAAWMLGAPPGTLAAPEQWTELTAETPTYRIKVRIGPPVTMAMSSMTTVDQGQPVNHHLEVHIFEKKSRTEVKTLVPVVTITNRATRASRQMTNVRACLVANHRETEPHFGDNLYLPDGTYAVTVRVGNETATFQSIAVKASGGM